MSSVTPPAQVPTNSTGPAIRQSGDLRNFDLQGRVTRPAPEQPAPTPSTLTASPPAPRAAPDRAPSSRTVETQAAQPSPSRAAAAPARTQGGPARAPSLQDFELPASPGGAGSVALPTTPEVAGSEPVIPDIAPADETEPGLLPMLPWLIAALALAGAGALFLYRRRARPAYAGTGGQQFALEVPASPPAQAPAPAPPPPAAPLPPAAAGGVVASSLRPWIDLEFHPERVVVDAAVATLEFSLVIVNSGAAVARDVLVEATMLNASAGQDQRIASFFANPVGQGETIPTVAPFQRLEVRSSTPVRLDQLEALEIEGRSLLVPIVALNALYRWGGSSRGQTSVSHLIGKDTGGDKLAPLRLDLGPRVFRALASRAHRLGVRR